MIVGSIVFMIDLAARYRLLEVGIGLAVLIAFLTLLMPSVGSRPPTKRSMCNSNLRMISLALILYHDDHGSFPPPYIADDKGNPMHSWRVLILPYLDQRNLYKQYRFDEPWDGPTNRQLHDVVLKLYSCPSRPANQPATDANYVAVVGPKTTFPEDRCVRTADMIDGTSATILLVEVYNSGIHWMEPRDLHIHQMPMAINPAQGQSISSDHNDGANVSFADGSVRFLRNDTSQATIRALLTRSGKEPPGDF